MSIWKSYLVLCRVHLSLFAACSAATGFFLFSYPPDSRCSAYCNVCLPFGLRGISIKSTSRERHRREDGKNTFAASSGRRPNAWRGMYFFCVVLLMSGEFLLAYAGGAKAFVLGLVALLWYHSIYFYLKRVTAFAFPYPETLLGSFLPAIGWIAAGGAISDGRLTAICFLFFPLAGAAFLASCPQLWRTI